MDWAFHESQVRFDIRAEREECERLFAHPARVLQDRLARCGGGDRTSRPAIPEWKRVHLKEVEERRLLHQARVLGWGKEKAHYYVHKASLATAAEEVSRSLQVDSATEELVRAVVTTPKEVAESRKRIRFIVMRMREAVANREFEKARFYFDEESKERTKLRVLYEQHGISGWPFA